MFVGLGLHIAFAIAMCIHVVKTGREMYWLFIILAFPGMGPLVYLIVAVLPDLMNGGMARGLTKAARQALNPEGEYRAAKELVEDSPTVANRMRLAAAAMELNRYDEAERLYAEAAHGIHSEDTALLMGRARALVELDRAGEALPLLEQLGELGEAGRTPQAALLMGRAYHALGRETEADTAYGWAAGRMPGQEGLARYAVFLAETGRTDEAREALGELDKRLQKSNGHFRKEARHWRDFAAAGLDRH